MGPFSCIYKNPGLFKKKKNFVTDFFDFVTCLRLLSYFLNSDTFKSSFVVYHLYILTTVRSYSGKK